MKLLTIGIPCYNSASYMDKAIKSALAGGNDVQIIIVDDGSSDETADISDRYAKEYPDVVQVIHKKNGGHGSAVNAVIEAADGLYIKILDSDDWLDSESLEKVLKTIKYLVQTEKQPDLILTNYVYEKEGKRYKKVITQPGFPKNKIFSWSDVHHFRLGHYILMHAAIYKLSLLRECGLKLPEHTFYVDNLYVYLPLPYVHTMYYLDVNLYRYYIGRSDQSVNEQIMIKRIDQQLAVNIKMIENDVINKAIEPNCKEYMMRYAEIITIISSVFLIKAGDKASLNKKNELWDTIKHRDPALYSWLNKRITGKIVSRQGKICNAIVLVIYKFARKIFKFN